MRISEIREMLSGASRQRYDQVYSGVSYPSVNGVHGKRANGVSNFLWVVHCDNEYRLQPIIVPGLRICGLEIGCIYLGESKRWGMA